MKIELPLLFQSSKFDGLHFNYVRKYGDLVFTNYPTCKMMFFKINKYK